MTSSPSTSAVSSLRQRWEAARARWWVRWGVDLLLVLAVVAVGSAFQTRHHLAGVAAPAFTLQTLEGKTVTSTELTGTPTLLAFWAPWCGVCKAETDNVSRVMRWAGARGRVLSVAAAFRDERDVRAYVAEHGVDYPVLLGSEAQTEAFRVEAYPTVYFLDEAGRVKGSAVGYTTTLGLLWRLLL